jgi:DNA-binding NarL/FixJ family response regulator
MTTIAMLDMVERAEPLPAATPEITVALIDRRALYRECFAKCLRAVHRAVTVQSYGTVSEWSAASAGRPAGALVLLCVGARRATEPEVVRDLGTLSRAEGTPAILMSDSEDPDQILGALDNGARGYIPTSTSLEVVVEALRLVDAGGVFVPASSLISARRAGQAASQRHGGRGMFTPRQTAVLDALRHGKANKVIAFELNMRESTVKVHVRNIMRKLKARNRTEVAFLTHEMFRNAEAA